LLIGLKTTCQNTLLLTNTFHPARNIDFIFDEHLTFSDQITSFAFERT